MTIRLSRRGDTPPFHAMDVLARANALRASGAPVISLALGEPSDAAPKAVRDAAASALGAGAIGYTDALGTSALRAAIAAHYGAHYGIEVAPSRIIVTTGSSAGFNLAFLALFDAGDRVAIPSPGYPPYRNIMAALGLDVVEIEHEGPYLTAAAIESAHRIRPLNGVLFASPSNPTGAVIPAAELERITIFAREAGITVISDEIYHRLNYSGEDATALAFGDDAVVVNSFSKYYCMTGWRIGWMVVPEAAVRQVERIQQSLYISAPALSQAAALHAFGATAELEAIKERYKASRALLAQHLPRIGLPLAAPMDGAFYAYCDSSGLAADSMELAWRVLEEAYVAITPGVDFDLERGHGTVRLSFAGSSQDIAEAVRRLES